MNVGSLKSFLKSLSQFVRESQGAQVAKELDRLCDGLTPFDSLSTAAFSDFLVRAEEYHRTGIVAAGKGRRQTGSRAARTASPELIKEAAQRVMNLYERAADQNLGYEAIDAEIRWLSKLSKDAVVQLAREVGIAGKPKTKKEGLEQIERKIKERKGTYDRVKAIGGISQPSAAVAHG